MPLDPFKESPLLFHKLGSYSPVQRMPGGITEEGSNKPAEKGRTEGSDTQGDEGVQRDDLGDPVSRRGGDGHGEATTGKSYEGGDD